MLKFETSNTTNSKQARVTFPGPTSVVGKILIKWRWNVKFVDHINLTK